MATPFFRALAGRWPALAFLLLAAGIGAFWQATHSAHEAAVLRERGRELQAIAELKIAFVRAWLEDRRSDAVVLGQRRLLAIALTGRDADPAALALAARVLPEQIEAFRREYGYAAVLLLDREGRLVRGAGDAGDQVPAAAADTVRTVLREGRAAFSPAYRAESGGQRHAGMDIVAPVFDRRQADAPVVGALVLHLDVAAHLDPVLTPWPGADDSGETLLVARTNGSLVYLGSPRHPEAAGRPIGLRDHALPSVLAAHGAQGIVEGADYRNVPVLAAVGRVPGMPWFVVAKLDRDEVLAPVRQQALLSGVTAGLLVLALGLTVFFWQRHNRSELALARLTAREAARAVGEARFRKLHEHGSDIGMLFDHGMVIRYASRRADDAMGRPALGLHMSQGAGKVHPEDAGKVEAARRAALAHPGTPQRVRHRFEMAPGRWHTLEATFTSHFDDPDIAGLFYEAHDITGRIEAERSLAQSEAWLRAVFGSAPVGIAIADAAGRYILVNRAQCEMLGYAEEELLGKGYLDFTHPEDVQPNLALTSGVRQGGIGAGTMEKRYVRKDGAVVWVLLTVAMVRTAAGETIGSVGVAQDLTGRREAEARRLETVRRQRDTLVREVHHRIKNHLQGLAGLLRQHAHEQPALAPVLQKFVAQIGAISAVHGLQGRAGRGDPRLRELAREIADFLGGLTGAPIPLDCPATECRWAVAEAEAVPVALILNEILTNALRHGADPSGVAIALRCDDGGARIAVRNPGRLGEGVDYAAGQGLGTGLTLIRSLLPPAGAAFRLRDCGDGGIEACLDLSAPVVRRPDHACLVEPPGKC